MWSYAMIATALLSVTVAGKEIIVTSSSCGTDTDLRSYNDVTLKYDGGYLESKVCLLKIENSRIGWNKDICVEQVHFNLPCGVTVKYDSGYSYSSYSSIMADKTFTCHSSKVRTWCARMGTLLYIAFEDTARSQSGSVELKITEQDSAAATIVSKTVTSVVVIIVVVISIIVAIIIGCIVLCCCVCNRRRSAGVTVALVPQPAVVTTTGYQQPPQGYQPPPQGYQPPPQGYPPQPQGYPQQPQGYAVGFEANGTEKPVPT